MILFGRCKIFLGIRGILGDFCQDGVLDDGKLSKEFVGILLIGQDDLSHCMPT